MSNLCPSCYHVKGLHYDERGCHCGGCSCTAYYEMTGGPVNAPSYSPPPIHERRAKDSTDYLDELWDEIQEWHADILN